MIYKEKTKSVTWLRSQIIMQNPCNDFVGYFMFQHWKSIDNTVSKAQTT